MQCTGEGGAEEEGGAKEEEGGLGSLSEVSSICTSSGCLPACQSAAMAGMAFFCSDVSPSQRALAAEGSMAGSGVERDDCGYGRGSGFI